MTKIHVANAILWRSDLRSIKQNFNCGHYPSHKKAPIKGEDARWFYLADYEKEYIKSYQNFEMSFAFMLLLYQTNLKKHVHIMKGF